MEFSFPEYLRYPGVQEPVVRFAWDQWNVEAIDMPLEKELQERLHRISQRAVAAFTIGTAEWIIFRFGGLLTDPEPSQRLEAARAQLVDNRYSSQTEIDMQQWRGPVRGPVGTALRRVVFALDQAYRGAEPAWRAGRASKLAEHVLTDPSPYRRWREQVLQRFEKIFPVDPKETLGDVVPAHAWNPDFPFDIAQTEVMTNQFLRRLNYETNLFLNSPQAMLRLGFKGTPYVFSYAADRKARYEW